MGLSKLCLVALGARVAYSLSVATDPEGILGGGGSSPAPDPDASVSDPEGILGGGGSSPAPHDAPEWCKSSAELTVEQRKERATTEAKQAWAKKEAASLIAKNDPVPSWLADAVAKDERRNATNWAVRSAMLLKEAELEVPDWLKEKVEEAEKGANQWAACKAAELRKAGEEVPQWMADSARRGIVQAANEKIQDLQDEINELEGLQEDEAATVEAGGDLEVAKVKALAATKASAKLTVDSQGQAVSQAMLKIAAARGDKMAGDVASWTSALMEAKGAAKRLLKVLDLELAKV